MDQTRSNVDSLLEQAGLLNDSRRQQSISQEAQDSYSTVRTPSATDLDADMLGVKLDDCSRYFKREIMVTINLLQRLYLSVFTCSASLAIDTVLMLREHFASM